MCLYCLSPLTPDFRSFPFGGNYPHVRDSVFTTIKQQDKNMEMRYDFHFHIMITFFITRGPHIAPRFSPHQLHMR